MNIKISTVVLFTGLVAAATAQAQGFTQPWHEMTPLTEQDRGIIRNTVQVEIHGKPAGTVANWANPASGHSGRITLLDNSVYQGMPCERIGYLTTEPGGSATRPVCVQKLPASRRDMEARGLELSNRTGRRRASASRWTSSRLGHSWSLPSGSGDGHSRSMRGEGGLVGVGEVGPLSLS